MATQANVSVIPTAVADPATVSEAHQDAVSGVPAALASTPAARAFLARISEAFQQVLSQRRPWVELIDRSSFAKPESTAEATVRIRQNWSYFRVNYALLLTAVVAFCLITNPVSLILLCGVLGAWVFMYLIRTDPLVLFNRAFSEREVLALMGVLTVVVVFLTDVGSVLISAAMIGIAIVCVHAAFRVPDVLFLDEEGASTGVLSFLSVKSSQPPLPTHV